MMSSTAWAVAVVVIALLFRKQISSLLERSVQLKFGDKEVSLPTPELEVPAQRRLSEGVASKEESNTLNQEELVAESVEKVSDLASQDSLFSRMLDSFFAKDLEQAENLFKELQEAESNSSSRMTNEMFYLYMKYRQGDFSSIEKLQNFTKNLDASSDAYYWIGACYESTNDFEKALAVYEQGEQTAQTAQERAKLVKEIADCLFNLGKKEQAFSKLMDEISKNEPSELSELYVSLAKLYEKEQDFELRAIALDKAIENFPNNTKLRFSAAYAYSQKEFYTLSLFHYKTLLSMDSNDGNSLNNLGVAYSRLGMPTRSIKSYKKAFELEETLAASNLAYQYMEKGFIEEASQILDIARQKASIHPNVGSALVKLSDIEEKEAKKEEVSLTTALEQRQFLLKFAEAFFSRSSLYGFDGIWKLSSTTNIEIKINDLRIEANWTQNDEKFKLEGPISNQAARLTYYHYRQYSNDDSRAYAYLSKDGKQLLIMLPKSTQNSFITLHRMESLHDQNRDSNHEA